VKNITKMDNETAVCLEENCPSALLFCIPARSRFIKSCLGAIHPSILMTFVHELQLATKKTKLRALFFPQNIRRNILNVKPNRLRLRLQASSRTTA